MAKSENSGGQSDFTRRYGKFGWPGLDAEAFAAAQQKTWAAWSAAGQILWDGVQAAASRQAELARAAVEADALAAREVWSAKPEERVAKQVAWAKQTYDRSAALLREVGELAAKAQGQAYEALNRRVVEGFDELGGMSAGDAK